MSDQAPPPPPPPPPPPTTPPPPPPGQQYAAPVQYGAVHIGKVRSTDLCSLLYIVTLGTYGLVWWFLVHDDMKTHSGQGIGGLVALILAFFSSDEVGKLYERSGRQAPVSALTGLWFFPGIFLIFLPIVWF